MKQEYPTRVKKKYFGELIKKSLTEEAMVRQFQLIGVVLLVAAAAITLLQWRVQ